eukprot:s828_g19.t1
MLATGRDCGVACKTKACTVGQAFAKKDAGDPRIPCALQNLHDDAGSFCNIGAPPVLLVACLVHGFAAEPPLLWTDADAVEDTFHVHGWIACMFELTVSQRILDAMCSRCFLSAADTGTSCPSTCRAQRGEPTGARLRPQPAKADAPRGIAAVLIAALACRHGPRSRPRRRFPSALLSAQRELLETEIRAAMYLDPARLRVVSSKESGESGEALRGQWLSLFRASAPYVAMQGVV